MINSLYINGTTIFAGTLSGTIYKRPLSQMISSVKILSKEVPDKFSLSQNYPNPFNPVTKIRFSITKSQNPNSSGSMISLTVYDLLGKQISTLINQQLQPGMYEIDFDGAEYPSGIYYYRLITESFTQTKKMMLIK